MDWSLVLVSQGIECSIDAAEDGGEWGLLVAPADYDRAMLAISQYREENRGWPWQQRWRHPGVVFDWGSLAWVLLLAIFFALSARTELESAGLMDSASVARGEWWRLFTAVWLHADLAHLAANASVGFVLLGLAMGHYGTGTGLLASYLAGFVGNMASCWLGAAAHRSLGASGMVMGSLGLLAVHSFSQWRTGLPARKYLLRGLAGGIMLFVLLGLTPETDILAHLGGFLGGVLLGGLATTLFPRPRRLGDLVAGLLFALLVIVPWWLALKHARP